MIEIVDFDAYNQEPTLSYGGNAGRKFGVIYHDEAWMLKYPESTKYFHGKHLPAYTSSPISEYIGSHVYKSLGIPVHDTVLGCRDGKIIVACRDFTENNRLMPFSDIKNSVSEECLSGVNGSSTKGENLSDVLRVMQEAKQFSHLRSSVAKRFWDMFVVDAFILNNDRHNGNWGLLVKRFSFELAPVFDNGNALFNKRNPSAAERRLQDPCAVAQDALSTGVSFFTDENGVHIHPCEFISSMQNEDCNAAVLRFIDKVDMAAIHKIIDDIPESAFGLTVITPVQKQYCKDVMDAVYYECLLPTSEKLRNVEAS